MPQANDILSINLDIIDWGIQDGFEFATLFIWMINGGKRQRMAFLSFTLNSWSA